jgi:hypothetical protein
MKKYHSEEPDPEDEPLGWDLPGGLSRMAQGYALASFMFMSIYADLSMPLFFGVVLYEHGWPAWIVTCTVIALWIVFIIIDWMIGNFAAERLARTER